MQPYELFLNNVCEFPKKQDTWKAFFAYLFLVSFGLCSGWAAIKLYYLYKNVSKNPLTLSHVITLCWLITSLSFFINYLLYFIHPSTQSLNYGILILLIPQQLLYV